MTLEAKKMSSCLDQDLSGALRVCSASWKVRDDLETGEELEESDGLQVVLDWCCRLI